MISYQVSNYLRTSSGKIVSNTLFQLLTKVFTMSVTFVVTIIISREYGSEGYGFFSIVLSFPAVFYLISDFGLNAIAVREISKNQEKTTEILNNVFFLRLIISLTAIAICLFSASILYTDTDLKYGIFVGSIMIVSQTLVTTANIVFQYHLKYMLAGVANAVGYLFILVTTLYLTSQKVDIIYLNIMYVLGSLITMGVAITFMKKVVSDVKINLQRNLAKHLILESLPLGLCFVFSQINFRADSVLLSVLKSPGSYSNLQTVGIYGLPYKFFEVLLVLPTFIMNSVYPVMLEKFKQGHDVFNKYVYKVITGMAILGVLVSLLSYVISFHIMNLENLTNFFGPEFIDSRPVFLILGAGIFIFFLTQPLSWKLVIQNQQRVLPKIYLTASVFNIGANFVLIPIYGFVASACITIASEFIIFCLLYLYAKKLS